LFILVIVSCILVILLVPKEGFEPSRACAHHPLKMARLPFRHFGMLLFILIFRRPHVPTPYSLAGTPPQDHTQADDYQKNRPKVRPKRTGEDAQLREQPKSAYNDEYQTTPHLNS
jgi:hypothetical protein